MLGVESMKHLLKQVLYHVCTTKIVDIDTQKLLLGQLINKQIERVKSAQNFSEIEFKVYSQGGDDGIIQYLIHNVPITKEIFIEFGVEDYIESNTRFLTMNNNWKGLIIDGGRKNIEFVKKQAIYRRHELTAVSCFLTRENVNQVFADNGFVGEIGLLSIDIDGNDYWIWEGISVVNPDIVIVEYNSVFGNQYAVTIPYDPQFYRTRAHYSNLYYGCSLKALCLLAEKKGYVFVGCNSLGNNAYFVKKDKAANLSVRSHIDGYVESKFREAINEKGKRTFVSGKNRFKVVENMPLYDIETDRMIKVGVLY